MSRKRILSICAILLSLFAADALPAWAQSPVSDAILRSQNPAEVDGIRVRTGVIARGPDGVIYAGGSQDTTFAQALAALPANGGTIDLRSSNITNLGTIDTGDKGKPVTILLGALTYTATQIVLRAGLRIIGTGDGWTKNLGSTIQAASASNPLFIGPPNPTDMPAIHVFLSDFVILGPSAPNTTDCFRIDASASSTGVQGMWDSSFERLTIEQFGGVSLHFIGANLSGRTGVNQRNSFYDLTVYRGAPGGGEALRIEGANYQFYFHQCFLDSAYGDTSVDPGTVPNIFIGGGPGGATNGFPYIMAFYGLTTEGSANLIQIDGAMQVLFYGMHNEAAYGVAKITYGANGSNVPTHGVLFDACSFNGNVGVNSGSGYIINVATPNALNIHLRDSAYMSNTAPDAWILNPNNAVGVQISNQSYGLPGGTGQMLNFAPPAVRRPY